MVEIIQSAPCFNFCAGELVDTRAFFIGTPRCTGLPGALPYVAGCTIDDIEHEIILTTSIPGATFTITSNNGSTPELLVDLNQTNNWDYEEYSNVISVSSSDSLEGNTTTITPFPITMNGQMYNSSFPTASNSSHVPLPTNSEADNVSSSPQEETGDESSSVKPVEKGSKKEDEEPDTAVDETSSSQTYFCKISTYVLTILVWISRRS